jgi:WhiB family transcriptional regulator, redox-sensing transcriptional regulator
VTPPRRHLVADSHATSVATSSNWRDQAACLKADASVQFFPDDDGGRQWSPWEAIKVCRTCPVVLQCRDEADRTEGGGEAKVQGVWGGEGPGMRLERRRAARRRAKAQ